MVCRFDVVCGKNKATFNASHSVNRFAPDGNRSIFAIFYSLFVGFGSGFAIYEISNEIWLAFREFSASDFRWVTFGWLIVCVCDCGSVAYSLLKLNCDRIWLQRAFPFRRFCIQKQNQTFTRRPRRKLINLVFTCLGGGVRARGFVCVSVYLEFDL